jgi:hypothetical protein
MRMFDLDQLLWNVKAKKPHSLMIMRLLRCVVPSRIELESKASETLILSVVLQDQNLADAAYRPPGKGTAKLIK